MSNILTCHFTRLSKRNTTDYFLFFSGEVISCKKHGLYLAISNFGIKSQTFINAQDSSIFPNVRYFDSRPTTVNKSLKHFFSLTEKNYWHTNTFRNEYYCILSIVQASKVIYSRENLEVGGLILSMNYASSLLTWLRIFFTSVPQLVSQRLQLNPSLRDG